MIEVTDWAADILSGSQEAANRFDPNAVIRVAETRGGVEAQLTESPAPDDQSVELTDMTVYVQAGLEGLLDVEEPHDRLVLRPPGSTPNVREH